MKLHNFIIHAFIAVFMNTIFTTTNCMEPIEKKTTQNKKSRIKRLATRIGTVLLGKNKEEILFPEFADLPKDLQDYIVTLLTINSSAETVEEAAMTINALAQVNKELNELINSPEFCLKIINHLSNKFNLPTVTVATTLETHAAQDYVVQQIFNSNFSDVTLLTNKTINMKDENGNTLLMHAVNQLNISLVAIILKNKKTNINKQNNDGNTALHLALYTLINAENSSELLKAQKIAIQLIHAGASFFIKNNNNETAKSLSNSANNNKIIKAMSDQVLNMMGI